MYRPIRILVVALASAMLKVALVCCVLAAAPSYAARVIVLNELYTGSSVRFRQALRQSIADAGFTVEEVNGLNLPAKLGAEPGPGAVLVLPDATRFPAEAKAPLDAFLKRGNHLIAVSGPAFATLLVNDAGEWLDSRQAAQRLAGEMGDPLIDFAAEDLSKWNRETRSRTRTDHGVEPSGDPRVRDALHVKISKLENWDILASPPVTRRFPEPHSATAFWAKGGPKTRELVVEWREKDGSRWIGAVKLTTEWTRCAMPVEVFKYWPDNSSQGRGGKGDHFNPENADRIAFGLSQSHSSQAMNTAHEYWVADVRAVNDRFAGVYFQPMVLESLSPSYKTYRTFAARVQNVQTGEIEPAGTPITAPVPRPPGFGSDAVRQWRWIPVLRALDGRGTAAHLFLNTTTEYAGSVWGFVGFDQDYLERTADRGAALVTSMLQRMAGGLFLSNAGSDRFGYADGETTTCAAYAVNLGPKPADVSITFSVLADGREVHSAASSAALPPGTAKTPIRLEGGAWKLPPGRYTIKTTLQSNGKVVDEISHEFHVVRFGPIDPSEVVTARGGEFYLNGKPWRGVGINFWPRWCTGREDQNYIFWLSPWEYNPEIVEQDLDLANSLGINLLSTWHMKPEQAGAVIDFLERARRHGLKVNLFVPGLTPLCQVFSAANELITSGHVPQSPAVFAYDIGWEVTVGRYEARCQYDGLWQDWVIDRYGSLESAAADWKFTPESKNGTITGPTDRQLNEDGEWRTFVAAYRRFWDDELSKRYRRSLENIRRLDRTHLVGVRSGWGGNGSEWTVPNFPVDLMSGAKHLDFTSPEGYALSGERAGFLKGGLVTAYARFGGGGKPVFWCEYGTSASPGGGPADAIGLQRQKEYYPRMLEMIRLSHANASAGWWWPGGYRVEENSDFGIVNPDGTPRPAALEIARAAAELKAAPHRPAPDYFITIDRDEDVRGFVGIYARHAEETARAIAAGKTVGIRTAGTGTTSANAPLVAVGNVPYNGHNPPKYLNAEFNWLRINGRLVHDDDVIQVERGKPVYVEASVANTAEAKWLALGRAGGVCLLARCGSQEVTQPISADTPFLSDAAIPRFQLSPGVDADTPCSFLMRVVGRADFGEVVRVTLRPK